MAVRSLAGARQGGSVLSRLLMVNRAGGGGQTRGMSVGSQFTSEKGAKAEELKNMQDKLNEKKEARKKSDVHLGTLKADGSSKRFYNSASVEKTSVDDPRTGCLMTMWGMTLDGRQVRTPAQKHLLMPNEMIARALALEWDSQDIHVKPFTMPLMTIATTVIDQMPKKPIRQHCIDGMLRVANCDLTCLRSSSDADLIEREEQVWGGLINWISDRYKCKVMVSRGDWMQHKQTPELVSAIEADLNARSDWTLAALDQVSGVTGSFFISMGLCEGFLDAEQAVACTRVHENFQIERWGKVESCGLGGHDIDEADLRVRVSAAAMWYRMLPTTPTYR